MRAARIAGIVAIAAVVGFAAARWLGPERSLEPPGPAASVPAAPAEPAPSAPAAPAPTAPPGELRIASGGRVALDAAALEPGKPVVLHLDIGEPSPVDAPRPVRIAAADGRELELEAPLGADRSEARLEIDPAFLTPGAYLVEVKTTEATPLPLRRYVIEVR